MRVILRQLAERMAPRIVAGLGLAPPSQQALGAQADEPERSVVPESLAILSSSAYLDDVVKLCRTTTDGDFARAECDKLAPTVGLRPSEKPGKCQAEQECVEVLGAHLCHTASNGQQPWMLHRSSSQRAGLALLTALRTLR